MSLATPTTILAFALGLSFLSQIWDFTVANSNVLAALATIFIAITSLYVSLRTLSFADKQRRHNEYSLRPLLYITRTHPAQNEKNCHGLHLRNFGTGPAQNVSYEFEFDGVKYQNQDEFYNAFRMKFVKDGWAPEYSNLIGRYFVEALFPNQSERFLWLYPETDVDWPVNHPQNKEDIIESFHDLLKITKVHVKYHTPYQEVISFQFPLPKGEQNGGGKSI